MEKHSKIVLHVGKLLQKKACDELNNKSSFQDQYINSLLCKESEGFKKQTMKTKGGIEFSFDQENVHEKKRLIIANEQEAFDDKKMNSFFSSRKHKGNKPLLGNEYSLVNMDQIQIYPKTDEDQERKKSFEQVKKYKKVIKNMEEMSQAEKSRYKFIEGLQKLNYQNFSLSRPSSTKNQSSKNEFEPLLTPYSDSRNHSSNYLGSGKVKLHFRRCNNKSTHQEIINHQKFSPLIQGTTIKTECLFNNQRLASAVRPRSSSTSYRNSSLSAKNRQLKIPYFSNNQKNQSEIIQPSNQYQDQSIPSSTKQKIPIRVKAFTVSHLEQTNYVSQQNFNFERHLPSHQTLISEFSQTLSPNNQFIKTAPISYETICASPIITKEDGNNLSWLTEIVPFTQKEVRPNKRPFTCEESSFRQTQQKEGFNKSKQTANQINTDQKGDQGSYLQKKQETFYGKNHGYKKINRKNGINLQKQNFISAFASPIPSTNKANQRKASELKEHHVMKQIKTQEDSSLQLNSIDFSESFSNCLSLSTSKMRDLNTIQVPSFSENNQAPSTITTNKIVSMNLLCSSKQFQNENNPVVSRKDTVQEDSLPSYSSRTSTPRITSKYNNQSEWIGRENIKTNKDDRNEKNQKKSLERKVQISISTPKSKLGDSNVNIDSSSIFMPKKRQGHNGVQEMVLYPKMHVLSITLESPKRRYENYMMKSFSTFNGLSSS